MGKKVAIASAINDTKEEYERNGTYTLDCLKKYGRMAVQAGDATLLDGLHDMARQEGILLEPSAAITVDAIRTLRVEGHVTDDERVVIVATGHGLKDLSHVTVDLDGAIAPDFNALNEYLID